MTSTGHLPNDHCANVLAELPAGHREITRDFIHHSENPRHPLEVLWHLSSSKYLLGFPSGLSLSLALDYYVRVPFNPPVPVLPVAHCSRPIVNDPAKRGPLNYPPHQTERKKLCIPSCHLPHLPVLFLFL
ncbi:hypothetical protein ACLKA7_004586 [Drosophila subpalustris]